MSRRRKRHDEEEHIDETWLIPYADLLTLLLALFIVLFSMSSVDAKKFQALSDVFNEVFSKGSGILEYPNPILQENAVVIDKQDEDNQEEDKPDEDKQEEDKEEIDHMADMQELESLQTKINSYIAEKGLSEMLDTSLTDEGLLVLIRDNVLFTSGSDQVRTADLGIAKEISELLVLNPPRNIIISGHTDNVPINNSQFASNWELSVMRAVNFMKIIIENDRLDPSWFSAKGFGEYEPIATNETVEGKAQNRRVEILILPRN